MPEEPADSPTTEPVTVTVARRIAPGREADFEAFSRHALEAASEWPGFLGGGMLRPPPGGDEYHVVYRFRDAATQRAWEESDRRAAIMAEGDELMETVGVWRVRGLQDWFSLPGRSRPGAPKWKLALVAFAAVVPMSLAMTVWIVPALGFLGLFPRTLVTSAIFAGYMTWFAVPRLSELVHGWLYPRR